VDIITHGLASLAVARGLFPKAGRLAVISTVLAGIAADVDWLSAFFGSSTYLEYYRTHFHSVGPALFLAVAIVIVVAKLGFRWGGALMPLGTLPEGQSIPEDLATRGRFIFQRFFLYVLGAPVCAALLHLAMDACQSDGVMLLWPFSTKRFAADWLPSLDPWILATLIAAIALPELLRLVSSEIGAKSKKPRGRTGALVGLALIVVYIGVRATLHSNATALLESRSFHGESARRVAAYPESLSLATWHGIVETESALNQVDVNAFSTANFDADSSLRIYKPEPSSSLIAARSTRTAQRFLAVARMPKASVEKTDVGYVVILRDLRYAAAGESSQEIAALIELDPDSKVTSEELVWARDLRR
jgi:hypothetical protein